MYNTYLVCTNDIILLFDVALKGTVSAKMILILLIRLIWQVHEHLAIMAGV